MFTSIDHLVIAVADPDRAAADLTSALGIAVTGGGRHASGTWNRLAFLGDSYLELIGVWDAALAREHPIGRAALAILEAGDEGLATFGLAVAPGALGGVVASLRSARSAISDPLPGFRERPDGIRISWATAFAADLGAEQPPFLIEHEATGPEWGPAARAARARAVHPFGGQARLVGLEIAVADPPVVADRYRRALGITLIAAPDAQPGARETRIFDQHIRVVAAGQPVAPALVASASRCHVGIRGDAGGHVLVDLFGVRFARL